MTNSKQEKHLTGLPKHLIDDAVTMALGEDLGTVGDITTLATVPTAATSHADIVSRQDGVISGLDVAKRAFKAVDPELNFVCKVDDAGHVKAGTIVATVSGSSRAILTGERVALNFLGRMSGIASLTAQYVAETREYKAQIIDTRKTTPGLRAFEKYAVICGGGANHRVGLYDAILIKDNHIAAAGGLKNALRRAKAAAGHMIKIEVEVDTLEQLNDVLSTGRCDAVLLDNMKPDMLAMAVEMIDGCMLAEASGGVSLETVRAIAKSGVDLISVGALTHSAPVLDLGLDFND
ncbi:MAG: carboxylating nicotinate-nucleotide diphosphorylase [Hyphomicrobiaceae bacterium]